MAISIVAGSQLTGGAIDGGDVTINLPPLQQNDVVYVCAASGDTPGTPSGYTLIESASSSALMTIRLYRKTMGATPDTTVTVTGGGDVLYAMRVVTFALRGVNTSVPQDAAETTASGSTPDPDAAAITTVSTGSLVVAFAASLVHDTSVTVPSGMSNQLGGSSNDTNPCSLYYATKSLGAAQTYDPPAWSLWNRGYWVTITMAVRTAVTYSASPDAGSYAITGADVTAKPTHVVVAGAGAYAITGDAASTKNSRVVVAGAGSYAITGTDAVLVLTGDRQTIADAGSYVISGAGAAPEHNKIVVADAGAYTITGTTAGVTQGIPITAEAGSYTILGSDLTAGIFAESTEILWSGYNTLLFNQGEINGYQPTPGLTPEGYETAIIPVLMGGYLDQSTDYTLVRAERKAATVAGGQRTLQVPNSTPVMVATGENRAMTTDRTRRSD